MYENRKSVRWFPLLLAVLSAVFLLTALLSIYGTVEALGVNIDLEQCANGRYGENTTCEDKGSNGWVKGNVNAMKSEYHVGEFLPYRRLYHGLSVDSGYCFGMKWDVSMSDLPAIDYIGTYSWTIKNANPLWDTMYEPADPFDLPPPSSTFPIPDDPVIISGTLDGNSFLGILSGTYTLDDPDRVLMMWGGTLTSTGPYSNEGESGDLADFFSQSMEYCFVAHETEVVLAWSGHLADPVEWSAPGRPTGSPYHMANGTNNNMYTPPRTSETDLSAVAPDGSVTNQNFGRMELQLDLSSPTAITLKEVNVSGGSSNITAILVIVAVTGLVSLVLLGGIRKRKKSDRRNLNF